MKDKDKWANEWCLKYSSPGDFEEFGQAEAWHAGFKRAKEECNRVLDDTPHARFRIDPIGENDTEKKGGA